MYPSKPDMESFLPSEIARLVYGYLEEEECPGAAQAFLETSIHLKECLAVAKKGRKFNTRIFGLNLVDILDLLTEAISFVKEHSKEFKEENRKDYRLLSLIQIDNFSSSTFPDSSSDNFRKNDSPPVSTVQNPMIFDPRQPKKEDQSTSYPGSDFLQKVEAPGNRVNTLISPQKNDGGFKIKEESDEEVGYAMDEECSQNEELIIPNIEPEVQISSPPSGELHSRQEAPTVNVITNPIMVSGRPAQLVCQPYNMVQMLPTPYPGPISPNISTMYFPPNSIPQHPVMSVQAQSTPPTSSVQPTLYQTTVRTSASNTVWPKSKVTNSKKQQNAQIRLKDVKRFIMKSNIINDDPPSSAKLRPIAPKITQSLDNGVKVQVVHTKENPLVETNSSISKRNLRSRKKPVRTVPSKNQSSPSIVVNDKK